MSSSSLSDLGETHTDDTVNVTEASDTERETLDGNGSLVEKANATHHGRIVIEDWSETGRGIHVDFDDRETVPLTQGQFLGRGATGDVHETTVQGWKLAHKKIYFTRRVKEIEKKETSILTKLVHVHITQLIGTYTQKRILGVLMYPVAVCDLHTFFEDVEAWSNVAPTERQPGVEAVSMDHIHRSRLEELGYNFPAKTEQHKATLVYSKIGCLISAVAYLHDQKIRHKDLKPSNILLSGEKIWLSDFGSATDFTLLSQSATNNERGTPRYFAPEVADWKPSGRAADIFSLGCVLVEILCLHRRGSLDQIRTNRSADPSFHANIDKLTTWLQNGEDKFSREVYYLEGDIKLMLSMNPADRSTASELLSSVTSYDTNRHDTSAPSTFSSCCKEDVVSLKEHVAAIAELQEMIKRVEIENERTYEKTLQAHSASLKMMDEVNERRYKNTLEAHSESLAKIRKAHTAETYKLECDFRDDLRRLQLPGDKELKELRVESERLRVEVEGLQAERRALQRGSERNPPVIHSSIQSEVDSERLHVDVEDLQVERRALSRGSERKPLAFHSIQSTLEKEKPPFAAKWPRRSFSSSPVDLNHNDQESVTRAQSPRSADGITNTVPKPSKDSINTDTISWAEARRILQRDRGSKHIGYDDADERRATKTSLRNRIASGFGLKRSGTRPTTVME